MADTNPLIAERSAEGVYRPVSAWAIAGIAIGGIYAGMVAATTIIALVRGEPFFLPSWVVVAPAAGAIISLLAQRQIQNSEGTRVGMGLARWGLGLSVVVGLGYFAYSMFTGMALAKQAGDFLTLKADDDSGFFARLQEGGRDPVEVNAAFLLTLPSNDREGLKKDDEKNLRFYQDQATKDNPQGLLSRFRTGKLVRAIVESGNKATEIESLGTEQWYYEKGAYHVDRRYRIQTPEVVFDMIFPVQTSRDRKGERKWFVNMPAIQMMSEEPTELGKSLTGVRRQLFLWLNNSWLASLNQGDSLADWDKLDQTNWTLVVPVEETREKLKRAVHDAFTGIGVNRLAALKLSYQNLSPWKAVNGRLRLHQDFALDVVLANGKRYMLVGEIIAMSRDPLDPRSSPPNPAWQIEGIKFMNAGLLEPGAGGPG